MHRLLVPLELSNSNCCLGGLRVA
uniref:Uncharacterized protein n=1 Tax=Arundo donax TaxID=35708 RepID=A0A0A8Z498_ARUDO